MSEKQASAKKPSSTQVILIVGIVVILAAILGVGALVVSRLGGKDPAAASSGPALGGDTVVAIGENAGDTLAEIDRKAKEGTYEVTMKVNWIFPDGKSPASDAYAANAQSNYRPVYFDVTMEDGTLIYTSPELPVGTEISDITLDTPLEKGEYPCVCTYHLLNDDKSELSSVSVAVQISVLA